MVRVLTMISFVLAMAGCSKNSGRDDTAPRSAPPTTDERPRLQRTEPLPEIVRDLLRTNMLEHGDSMEALLWSALMLDHQTTEVVARRFLAQPRMSRPTAGEETANAWLPALFFDLQDRMYQAAAELHKAAAAGDDLGTARAYGVLAETCVTCHSLYLILPADANREEAYEGD